MNSNNLIIPIFVLCFFATPSSSEAQTDANRNLRDTKSFELEKKNNDITIDGELEEEAWQNAISVPLNYERSPNPNADPPVKTNVFITYSQTNLFVGFKASDPNPEAIRAHLMDRDSQEKLKRDDHVGITIDPFNNAQWGFQFRINALGVQADAIYSDHRNSTNYSWNAIWESNGTVTENGYEVEIRIPLSSLNIPAESIQDWRFSAFRHYPRSVQHEIRSHPIDLNNQSFIAQFDQLNGLENLSSGLNLEVNPVLTAKRTDQNTASSMDQGSIAFSPGGNLRWGIQPNVNLSATVNPDFSQIEADALQLRENRRFVLSFPEKRPFFLEDSEIFDTPFNAVFTRSIIEPDAGAKLTGKSGDHSYGTFVTREQSSRILFPSNQRSQSKILDSRTYSEVVRYRNQLTDEAAIGILGEGRQATENGYHNYIGGIDGYFQFLESNSLRFQYLHSSTNYTDEISNSYDQPDTQFGGNAFQLNLSHASRNWSGNANFTSVSSGFRNDNGFFQRANYRTFSGSGNRIFRENSAGWFSSLQFGPAVEVTTDQSGMLTDRSFSFSATYTGPLQSEIYTQYSLSKQRFQDRVFSGMDTGTFFFRLQPAGFLSKFRLYAAHGGAIDFSNLRRSKETIIHPGLTFDISQNLNLEIDPNFQRLTHNGATTFTTYLLGTRLIYHFNKKTFVRSIFQYRYTDRNLDTFNNPEAFEAASESFFYQLLFSYKINPQSKLFLGYSSGYGGINNRPLANQSRTAFLKVGYAWVF